MIKKCCKSKAFCKSIWGEIIIIKTRKWLPKKKKKKMLVLKENCLNTVSGGNKYSILEIFNMHKQMCHQMESILTT